MMTDRHGAGAARVARAARAAILASAIAALCAAPIAAQASGARKWWRDASGPAYQVLVYSFADSDGDGFGDLRGLTAKLDWLSDGDPATSGDLGVSAIWLSPIHPSGSYHGYDVLDYKAVSPRLGTMADFEALVAAAHERGIKVLLDMVFNHSSREHPWFMAAMGGASDPYNAWYRTKTPGRSYGASGLGRFYDMQRLDGTTMSYFAAFGSGMPDLNLDNTDVVNELKSILAFWLGKGVDGFRFDAAKHAFDPNEVEQGSPSLALNKSFWNDLRRAARRVGPDVYFIGEVSTGSAQEIAAFAPVFDGLFDFPGAALTLDTAARGSSGNFLSSYANNLAQYARAAGFQAAPFLSNHDQDRAMSQLLARCGVDAVRGAAPGPEDNRASLDAKALALVRAKLAASISQTLPGLPFVYYGEELGMTGRRYRNDDVARRDAYPWAAAGGPPTTSWMKASGRIEDGQNALTPSAELQAADEGSLLSHYRRLSALRASSPAIRGGSFARVAWPGFEGATILAYLREETAEKALVLHNLGALPLSAVVPEGIALMPLWSSAIGLLPAGQDAIPASGSLEVEAYGSAVFTVAR